MIPRRTALSAPAAIPLARAARAQPAFPARPVRLIVPWAPGGATSTIARLVAEAMSPGLGHPVIVDHRPGAGGATGSALAARALADGHTLLIAGAATFYRPLLDRDLPYDPLRDLDPIGPIGDGPFALVARPGLPATLPALIALARANPGALNLASAGIGSTSQLTGELLAAAAGLRFTHVPYAGAGLAMVDLLFDALSTVLGPLRAGRILCLAVTTTGRNPELPDVPTVAEAALPGFSAVPWWGLVGPAGMPGEAVARLSAELRRALSGPALVRQLAEQGCRAAPSSPEAFRRHVLTENERWSSAIEAAGLRPR